MLLALKISLELAMTLDLLITTLCESTEPPLFIYILLPSSQNFLYFFLKWS